MNQFYRQYFDACVSREGTHAVKHEYLERVFGRKDVIPAWVADMDFRTAPQIQEALEARARHGIYGYTDNSGEEKQAEIQWLERRHHLSVQPDWILYSPGVVDSLFFCVRALTCSGDRVLIQTPVYGPFYKAAEAFGRELVLNPLRETDEGWRMDFEDLEGKFAQGIAMMILCSPHNPVGRVWERSELEQVLRLADRYGVIVVSDEIHADFVYAGHKQTRILALPHSDRCVLLTSASKSFNLAGLRQSSCIIPDQEMRERVIEELKNAHVMAPNIFGSIAQTTAYTCGDEWMDAVVEYIRENADYVEDFIRRHIPEISLHPLEGTYLLWMDFRKTGMSHETLKRLLIHDAGVGLNDGLEYGEEGNGHFRMNLAMPRRIVEQAMENIHQAMRGHKQ